MEELKNKIADILKENNVNEAAKLKIYNTVDSYTKANEEARDKAKKGTETGASEEIEKETMMKMRKVMGLK